MGKPYPKVKLWRQGRPDGSPKLFAGLQIGSQPPWGSKPPDWEPMLSKFPRRALSSCATWGQPSSPSGALRKPLAWENGEKGETPSEIQSAQRAAGKTLALASLCRASQQSAPSRWMGLPLSGHRLAASMMGGDVTSE